MYTVTIGERAKRVIEAHSGDFPRLMQCVLGLCWRLERDPRAGSYQVGVHDGESDEYIYNTTRWNPESGVPILSATYCIKGNAVRIRSLRIKYPDQDD